MVRLGTLLIAGCAWVVAGCGGADEPPPRQKPVQLQISAPSDTAVVQGARMEVRGRVSPSTARVRVQGRAARVMGGTFRSTVRLEHGANVIDVAATAAGRAAALTAFRVTREERVAVPDLVGLPVGEAEQLAMDAGLRLESERGGGFLDPLVPRRIAVCDQSPASGRQVRRGTAIQVLVARAC